MSKLNCNCSCSRESVCPLIAIAASIVIGIITTLLRITAVITVTPAFLWVILGIAVVYLAINLITATLGVCCGKKRCAGASLSLILFGILGAILTSIILLAITFAATSVIGAILTGALLFFFSLFITSTACLIKCLAEDSDYDKCFLE